MAGEEAAELRRRHHHHHHHHYFLTYLLLLRQAAVETPNDGDDGNRGKPGGKGIKDEAKLVSKPKKQSEVADLAALLDGLDDEEPGAAAEE